ncbi:MAG: UDP-N-acetylmuramate dehydrogenase [Bacteroidota bacterium]
MITVDEIKKCFRGNFSLNEPLDKFTSFRIGGPADIFLEPVDRDDLKEIIRYLRGKNVPVTIIGNGSNLLISDDGVRGAVVNLERGFNSIYMDGELVVVDAGVRTTKFVDFCILQGRKGVEMLAGIPGTLGGAVVMNAGAYDGEISDFLSDVEVLRGLEIVRIPKKDMGFTYRRSALKGEIVLGARFLLPAGDPGTLMKRRRELLVKRNQSQPLNLPNSGSVFKNPAGTFAGKLIEDAGLKGAAIGRARISEKHGNFIVNSGGAMAKDVLELILLAKRTVMERTKIILEPEVKLIGFPEQILKQVYS